MLAPPVSAICPVYFFSVVYQCKARSTILIVEVQVEVEVQY